MRYQKVKLIKDDGLELHFTRKDSQGDDVVIEETHKAPVHPDLKQVLKGMRVHLAMLTDYVDRNRSKNEEALEPFVVSGYSIGGKDDDQGVVVMGHRLTKLGQSVTLNTPFTRFEQPEDGYYFVKLLQEHIAMMEVEVQSYLSGEKRGKLKQTELFDSNGTPEPTEAEAL